MIDCIIIVIYLIIITAIGIKSAKKTKKKEDFFKVNSNHGVFAVISVLTSGFLGGGYSVGNAAGSFVNGIGYSVALCGFSVGIIAFALFVMPKIKTNASSLTEAVENSYGNMPACFTSFFSFLFCTGIVAAQLSTLGIILFEYFGLGKVMCIAVSASLIIIYSTLGGINAVVKTDIAQFLILAFGIPLLFIFTLKASQATLNELNPQMLTFPFAKEKIPASAFISLFIAFGVGEMITPQFIQKINLNKSRKKMIAATVISGTITAVFFIIIGLIGVLATKINPTLEARSVLVKMAVTVMPVGLKGVVGASLCAILISSADSSLNSASEALGKIVKFKSKINTPRIINLLCGILSVALVILLPDVMGILMTSYKFWTPVIFSQAIYAVMGKKGSQLLFYLPATVGILTVLIWDTVLKAPFNISAVSVGFFVNTVTFILTEITEKLLLKKRKSIKLKNIGKKSIANGFSIE